MRPSRFAHRSFFVKDEADFKHVWQTARRWWIDMLACSERCWPAPPGVRARPCVGGFVDPWLPPPHSVWGVDKRDKGEW